MSIDSGWAAAIIMTASGIGSSALVLVTIGRGQGKAKTREEQHTQEIAEIKGELVNVNGKLDKVMNGESKCKLAFTERIAKLDGAESIQTELTEAKNDQKEAMK